MSYKKCSGCVKQSHRWQAERARFVVTPAGREARPTPRVPRASLPAILEAPPWERCLPGGIFVGADLVSAQGRDKLGPYDATIGCGAGPGAGLVVSCQP